MEHDNDSDSYQCVCVIHGASKSAAATTRTRPGAAVGTPSKPPIDKPSTVMPNGPQGEAAYGFWSAARTAAARAAWPRALAWNGSTHEPGSRPSTSLIRSGWQKSWPIVGV
jgi:hypothetical protein